MRRIIGIIPVVLTPLTENKNIDVKGLVRIIEFLHTKDVGGLWVLGTGSEDMNLSFDNRLHVAQIACSANDGKLPLILGSGFFAMDDILTFMEETKGLNFDAYHVMPYNPKLSLNRLVWFYNHIADKATKPLWLYTSGNWSCPITTEVIRELSNHENIAGIKFSNTNTKDLAEVLALAHSEFQIITAVANQLFVCMCLGSVAHTSSLACCLPEPMIEIHNDTVGALYYSFPDVVVALLKQRRLNEFLSKMAKNTKRDNFLQGADEKYILQLREICDVYMTECYREISEEEKMKLIELLKEYQYDKFIG